MLISRRSRQAARWLREARAGSTESLGQLLQSCRGLLLHLARTEIDRRLQPKGGASDIVQQTFLDAQRDFSRFTGETEAELIAWLRLRLRFNATKFARSYREAEKRNIDRERPLGVGWSSSAPEDGVLFEHPTPSEQAVAAENDAEMRAALDRLPEEYRRAVELRYWKGLSFDQIGEAMARTPNAARKLWARAIDQLKREIRVADPQ